MSGDLPNDDDSEKQDKEAEEDDLEGVVDGHAWEDDDEDAARLRREALAQPERTSGVRIITQRPVSKLETAFGYSVASVSTIGVAIYLFGGKKQKGFWESQEDPLIQDQEPLARL
jgi:hypothetical protein